MVIIRWLGFFAGLAMLVGLALGYDISNTSFSLWLAGYLVFCGIVAVSSMPRPPYYDNPNED